MLRCKKGLKGRRSARETGKAYRVEAFASEGKVFLKVKILGHVAPASELEGRSLKNKGLHLNATYISDHLGPLRGCGRQAAKYREGGETALKFFTYGKGVKRYQASLGKRRG